MIKKKFFMGFCGLLGFLCLRYFFSNNLFDLTFIGFFAFFSYFIVARINGDKADERYMENRKSAMAFMGQFAALEIFILWCLAMILRNGEVICVLLALAYAITHNAYAIKLYLLEEK